MTLRQAFRPRPETTCDRNFRARSAAKQEKPLSYSRQTLRKLGQRDSARALMEASLASRERLWGDDDLDTQKARERLTGFPRDPE